jgi:G3E family GTPase
MSTVRFIMVGGFLGAGKTTTLSRLARHYVDQGKKVGLVTNDQAQGLVDTHNLREQGFNVEEVAGACFCCKFDDLVTKVESLQRTDRPDIILAEPVGSCTDLVATVVQPLKDLYADRFTVAPYAVIFKPSHGLRILRNEPGAGFSPKAAYIFRKQLEEADAIVINRLDELAPPAIEELISLVNAQHPGVPVLRVSAKTWQNFGALTTLLEQDGFFGRKILDIDYDTYAEGEAELGWLNSSVQVTAERPFSVDELLLDLIRDLQTTFRDMGAEVAHLKVIGLADGAFGVANLVSSGTQPELSLPSRCRTAKAEIIVNARVAVDPVVLQDQVARTVRAVCAVRQARPEFNKIESFRPGRPQPTHRYANAK